MVLFSNTRTFAANGTQYKYMTGSYLVFSIWLTEVTASGQTLRVSEKYNDTTSDNPENVKIFLNSISPSLTFPNGIVLTNPMFRITNTTGGASTFGYCCDMKKLNKISG